MTALDRILDRPCAIHPGTVDLPATHTNRNCWVHKQTLQIENNNLDKPNPRDYDKDRQQPGRGNGG